MVRVKLKRLGLVCGIAGLVVLIPAMLLCRPNDLGLTRLDILLNGRPDMDQLRINTRAAADAFLTQHKADLLIEANTKQEFMLDNSQAAKIRSLGYRSSFYYFCWDIYLPYSFRTKSGNTDTVVVQLSDALSDHRHDAQKFYVVRAIVLDKVGKVAKEVKQ